MSRHCADRGGVASAFRERPACARAGTGETRGPVESGKESQAVRGEKVR